MQIDQCFSPQQLDSCFQELNKSLSPNVISLESFFFAPDNRKIHRSCRRGTGVFLDSALILTTAQVVGRLTAFYEPIVVKKPSRFKHGQILHKSYIGSTVALTSDGNMLKTKPLAVNFGNDVAVLKAVLPEEMLPPRCALANSLPGKEDILMGIARKHNVGFVNILGNVRAIGEKTITAKAPWPLDDCLGWMEHNWFMFAGGDPPPGSILNDCREMASGSVTRFTGSPWFNLHGEVVGVASWEVTDEAVHFSVGFAVPTSCIKAAVDYAMNKELDDPIVMDDWIDFSFGSWNG